MFCFQTEIFTLLHVEMLLSIKKSFASFLLLNWNLQSLF